LQLTHQSEHDTWRIILLRGNAAELLLVPHEGRFALPCLDIPRWQRVAESLTAAVKAHWGQEAVCLFSPNLASLPSEPSDMHLQVMESGAPGGEPSRPTHWLPVSALRESLLANAAEFRAIHQSLAECQAYAKGVIPGPFAKLGWVKGLIEWVDEVAQPLGLCPNGRFRQLNGSPTFSLLRLETDGPAIWFKAVGEPNLREFPITTTVAALFPSYVPRILATQPAWNSWLATEAAGVELRQTSERADWKTAARTLADLQIESLGRTLHLLNAGCRDLRVSALLCLVDPFLHAMGHLMELQTKVPPPVLRREDLRLLGIQIKDSLELLEEGKIHAALGHLDFNPGNIVVSGTTCVFLDWAEAHVGHPFLTFQYLLEHFRRNLGEGCADEGELIAGYVQRWQRVFSLDDISHALAVAPLLAAFAFAVGNNTWMDLQRLPNPKTAGYLRSLTRRMKREADHWTSHRVRRSVPCLN
jgi:hypothetical protein